MIEKTIRRITKKLATLAKRNIPLMMALDVLEKTAKKPLDLVIINVLRENLSEASHGKSVA